MDFDGPFFILGVIPGTALLLALLVGIETRRRKGKPRGLIYLLAFFLLIPILLIEWLPLMIMGPALAEMSPVIGAVIVPVIALLLGSLLAYKLAYVLAGAQP